MVCAMQRTVVGCLSRGRIFAVLLKRTGNRRATSAAPTRRADVAAAQAVRAKTRAPPAASAPSLAAVARRQTSHLVFLQPGLHEDRYPMGDVPSYMGVCTTWWCAPIGCSASTCRCWCTSRRRSGDTNIDHRRSKVLRRFFFARAGTSLPTTANPADYKPGDIVTYYMRNGCSPRRTSPSSPAEKTATGVPLVVHNRGWGVQAEDWLFAEKITGHFPLRRITLSTRASLFLMEAPGLPSRNVNLALRLKEQNRIHASAPRCIFRAGDSI